MHFVNSDPYTCRGFLIEEVRELNGRDKKGLFAEPGRREDYRQQEAADIALFCLTMAGSIGIDLRTHELQKVVDAHVHKYGIAPVTTDTAMHMPPEMPAGSWEEATYEHIKAELNGSATKLGRLDLHRERDRVRAVLYELLGACFALYYLFGLDPYRAVREKIVRNELKYPAYLFALPVRQPHQTDRGYAQSIRWAYKRARALGARRWANKDENDKPRGPGNGTLMFYANSDLGFEYDDSRYTGEWAMPARAIIEQAPVPEALPVRAAVPNGPALTMVVAALR